MRGSLIAGLALSTLPLLLHQPAEAQTIIRGGPVFGINSSTFRGGDAEDAGSRTSFLLGGFLNFRINRQFAVQPELLYTRKGAETTIEDVTGTVALDYIEIPVLAQIRFPSREVVPYFLVGPAFSFKANCNLKVENEEVEISTDCDSGENDLGVSDTDFSLIGGVGLEIRNFTVSLRYDHGLSSLSEDGSDAYNQAFSITFGYAFRLGR